MRKLKCRGKLNIRSPLEEITRDLIPTDTCCAPSSSGHSIKPIRTRFTPEGLSATTAEPAGMEERNSGPPGWSAPGAVSVQLMSTISRRHAPASRRFVMDVLAMLESGVSGPCRDTQEASLDERRIKRKKML